MKFGLDSKHRKPVSRLEATPLPPSDIFQLVPKSATLDDCLILVCPTAEPVNKGTNTQKTVVRNSNNTVSCKNSADVLSGESNEQLMNVYRSKTSTTTTSASVGKTGSRLLSALNSSQW